MEGAVLIHAQVCGVDQCEGLSHIAGLSFCFFLGGKEHKTWTFPFVPLDFYEYKYINIIYKYKLCRVSNNSKPAIVLFTRDFHSGFHAVHFKQFVFFFLFSVAIAQCSVTK